MPVKQTSVFEFRRGLQPQVLYVEGSGFDQDLRKYLNGLYLLDPSYSMYETRSATGAYLVNLENLESSEAEETFKLYWRRLTGNCELAGLYEIERDCCIHLSMQLQTENAKEAEQALQFAKMLEQTLIALFKLHFKLDESEAACRILA